MMQESTCVQPLMELDSQLVTGSLCLSNVSTSVWQYMYLLGWEFIKEKKKTRKKENKNSYKKTRVFLHEFFFAWTLSCTSACFRACFLARVLVCVDAFLYEFLFACFRACFLVRVLVFFLACFLFFFYKFPALAQLKREESYTSVLSYRATCFFSETQLYRSINSCSITFEQSLFWWNTRTLDLYHAFCNIY